MAKDGKRILVVFWIWSCVLAMAWGEATPSRELAAAIQAIEQAPDPSATVAAYANGAAVDRNDPKLSQAYLTRMVDFGLPELAFHQAQTLTTLESDNGLAWGVIAYVEARRGNMAEAISAINLAGQFAPENPLVERTAGELMAWYDVKADKATLSENARLGLARIRGLLEKRPEFANAYETAKKAYKTQASVPEQRPGQSDRESPASPTESVDSYSDYYSTWDAGWVQPVPWWWWQPVGFFAGSNFFPLTTVLVFNDRDLFFRHHDRFFNRNRIGRFFNGSEFEARRDGKGGAKFFGLSATTNPSVAASRRESFRRAVVRTPRGTSPDGGVGLRGPSMSRRIPTRQGNTIGRRAFTVGASVSARRSLSSPRQMTSVSGRQFSSRPQVGTMGRSSMRGAVTSPVSAGGGGHGGGLGVSQRAGR
jgi:hypothetical protein